MKLDRYICVLAACLSFFPASGRVSARWKNTGDIQVLEKSVQKVDSLLYVKMKIDLTGLHVKPNLSVDIVPLMTGTDSQSLQFPKLLVTGRVRHIVFQRMPEQETEGQREVRRYNKEEQFAEYTASVPYEKWMGRSTLSVVLDLCGCGWDPLENRCMELTDVKINDLEDYVPSLAYMVPVKEKKVRSKSGSAYLDFPVDKIVIYPDYRDNRRELENIMATIDSVRNDSYATITGVSIKGYASPEGSYRHNAYLAGHRTGALLKYVNALYHFQNAEFATSSEPEDWEGLEQRVLDSDMEYRDDVLAVIRDTLITDPDVRDRRLKGLHGGRPYRYLLKEIYPALRRSEYTVTYLIRPFDNTEEAKALLYVDPKQLSLEEMYRIARTYETGSEEFNGVFDIAVRMYPNDPVANLNAANAALMRRDVKAARKYLDRVPDCNEKLLAAGALALLEGDKELSLSLFERARLAGMPEAEANIEFIRYLP